MCCTRTAGRNLAAGNSLLLHRYGMAGSMGRVGAAGDNAAMESLFGSSDLMGFWGDRFGACRWLIWGSRPCELGVRHASSTKGASLVQR